MSKASPTKRPKRPKGITGYTRASKAERTRRKVNKMIINSKQRDRAKNDQRDD